MRLIALVVAIATAPSAPAAERLLFNCFFPPGHYGCTQWVPEVKRRIEEATERRVRISVPPKSLAAPPDQYDAVVNGVVDGAFQYNGHLARQVPGIQFSLLPFAGVLEGRIAGPALWRTYLAFFGDQNEFGDAVLISVVAASGAEIFSTTGDAIESAEDIRNAKIWALPGVTATILKGAGASVVSGPAVQMLEVISKGVVDGYAGIGWASVHAFRLADYTQVATLLEGKIFQPTFSVILSRAKWERIAPQDRAAILDAMGADYAEWAGAVQDGHNAAAREDLTARGIRVVDGSAGLEADLRALGAPMVEAWISAIAELGIDGKDVLQYYRDQIDAYRAVSQD